MISTGFIDLYCERTAIGFWDEPLNAISNIAFLIAAFIAWRVQGQSGQRNLADSVLIILAGCIGIGSFLFHTFATAWAELADVIPIWSFVAGMTLLMIYRGTGGNIAKTLRISMIAGGITGISFYFASGDVTTETGVSPAVLNGSLQYLPAVIALFGFAAMTVIRRHPARFYVVGAAVTFLVSLAFRTVDLNVCGSTHGIGTHFLWHSLNGLMIGLLLLCLLHKFPAQVRERTQA